MKIYVVRHGETTWNKEEVFRGRKDIPLNDTGIRQAERTGGFFADKEVSVIYSSPLARARQTASAIGEASRVPVKVDDAFTDMDFGPWEGLSLAAVQERFPQLLDTWRKSPHRFRMQGAETLTQVRKRVRRGLREAMGDGPVVVIVAHRVICKLLVLQFLDVSNRFFWKIKCDPASITLAEQTGEEYTLFMVNQTLHLQGRAVSPEYRYF